MGYMGVKLKRETFDLLQECINDFIGHHPELKHIPISKNKIIYEMAKFYLKH